MPVLSPSIQHADTPGLCGSDLHGMVRGLDTLLVVAIANVVPKVYRGNEKPTRKGFIMGHEFTGVIVSVGSRVKNFKEGDQVVSPFTRYRVMGMRRDNFVVRAGNASIV